MKLIAFLLLPILTALAAPSNVCAVTLYKCKTKDGTTIYQNDPCPQDAATVAKGGYQRQPDDTRTNRAAMNYSNQVHAQRLQDEAMAAQGQVNEQGDSFSSTEPTDAARGFQCSGNGKVWMQSTPCPASTTAFKPVMGISGYDQYGNQVTGSGTLVEQVPVDQRGMSKSEVCNHLSQPDAQVSDKKKSNAEAGYERNKMRQANGC